MSLKKSVMLLGVKNLTIYALIWRKKNEGKYRIFNESKITYIECICKSEPFYYHICCFQSKT